MKKFSKITLFIFALGALSFNAQAQRVDEIIEKHIKAHGGKEKWDAVQSMKITGQYTSFSETKEFTTIKAKPDFYYSEFHLGKHFVVEASNGKDSWTVDPWLEIPYPRNVNEAETNVFLQKAEFCTPFFDYKAKGSTVTFEGTENLEGVDVLKLKLTRSNGMEEIWYLNSKTYLEFKMESQWIDFARPTMQTTFFDDFREVNGLVLPFYFEREFPQRHRVTEIENIAFNVDFDTKKCDMSRSNAMQKLEFLEGNWNVSVAVRTRSGAWYPLGSSTSKIEFIMTNLLQEKISYDRIFKFNKIIHYTYNLDQKKYIVSVYNDMNSNIAVFNGEYSDTLFAYENTKISYGDTANAPQMKIKYEIADIKENGFSVYKLASGDNGATWHQRDRFTYTRKED